MTQVLSAALQPHKEGLAPSTLVKLLPLSLILAAHMPSCLVLSLAAPTKGPVSPRALPVAIFPM